MNILAIDDHELFRKGLRHLLKGIDEKVFYEEASTVNEAIKIHHNYTPDLILLDYYLPGIEGVEAMQKVKSVFDSSVIVVISSLDNPRMIRQALDMGAAGFIPKSSSQSVLINALKISLAGGIYLPEQAIKDIGEEQLSISRYENLNAGQTDININQLTERQTEVIERLVKGMANKNIAEDMNISEGTVKSHLSSAFKVLGVNNRTQAVLMFAKHNFR